MREVTVAEPGYAYIFFSNENLTQVDVHFDDVKITHTHSNIVAGADYYPFGLVMDGREIDDEPYRWGYQGQYSEEDEITDWNQFALRNYDPRIGRWLSTDPYGQFHSPYVGLGNTPNMGVDPDGGYFSMFSWQGALVGAAVGAGIGLAFDKDNWGWYALGGAAAGGFFTSDFAKVEIWGTHQGRGVFAANGNGPGASSRELIQPRTNYQLKYHGNFMNSIQTLDPTPAIPRRIVESFSFKFRGVSTTVNPVTPRISGVRSRTIATPIRSGGFSDDALNEGLGANQVAEMAYSIYQSQKNRALLVNSKITFISTRPTLGVRNFVKSIVRRLIALGVSRKDIVDQVIPVENYENPKYQLDQLHTIISGQDVRKR